MTNASNEIVGVMVGAVIYRDLDTITKLLRDTNAPWEEVTRERMQFMAAMDLGPKWSEWAKAPTLFIKTENGYVWPNRRMSQEGECHYSSVPFPKIPNAFL